MPEFGIESLAAITVVAYLIGIAAKASGFINDRFIPVICGCAGGVMSMVWYLNGWPGLEVADPITALAVGIVSGLAATGVNQVIKQLRPEV